jgi:hypothetical protein
LNLQSTDAPRFQSNAVELRFGTSQAAMAAYWLMPSPADRTSADISDRILLVRGQRVVLDETLAALYGVETRAFNQAVRRNRERFPDDFLLQIEPAEWEILRSQTVILRSGHGRHLAFTEHGAIMAAMILNSPRAVQMSVYVVRAFVRFRQSLATHAELARELKALKRSVSELDADTRRQFEVVHEAILGLMAPGPRKQ